MTTAFTKFKPLLTLLVGFLAALGVLSLTRVGPAQAQSPGVNLAQLVATVNALKSQQATDEQTITSQGNTITSQGSTITAQAGQITALQAKTAPISVSGTDLTFTGVSVHIVNGQGSTTTTNGLGNLIVGYNAAGNSNGDTRSGSHNLILGDHNNYSSFGGLVAGSDNTISNGYASVSGGSSLTQNNTGGWSAGSLGSTAYGGKFTSP